jgi:RNA polymerase sigma-70 factor, ECF subfamily
MIQTSIPNRGSARDEFAIILKAKQGDRQALAELVNAYSDRIYNLALRILRNKEDAEDVMQETFLNAIEKLATFDERSGFYTWIYRIAVNASLMKLRRKKIAPSNYLDNPDFEKGMEDKIMMDWSQNPALHIDKREIKSVLDRAISELDERYRTVFVLRDIEDLSIRDTSKILEITEENVKIRLRRARIFLRDKLSEYFQERI